MDDKKKKYVVPEAEIIDFANDDIITQSLARGSTLNWGDETDVDNW